LKSQSVNQEPTNNIGIENKIQDTQIDTTVTYCFDAEGKIKSKSEVPIKVKFFFYPSLLKEMFIIVMLFIF